jgi:DNA-binding PadR family transcriptional regulator
MSLRFALLGLLSDQSMSGYDLTKWMERETSHFFVIGHSSIYPALARMEREGNGTGGIDRVVSLSEDFRDIVEREDGLVDGSNCHGAASRAVCFP